MSIKRELMRGAMALIACGLGAMAGWANNIAVSHVALVSQVKGSHWMVRFNVQWENSWRGDLPDTNQVAPFNYDATWVFVKYRVAGGDWKHASLSTNAADHVAPAGSTIAVGLTTNRGVGVFVYRNANGYGPFTANVVKLRWNYAADGVEDGAQVEVKVCAIEMVYVPEGAFKVGSGGTESGRFYEGGGGNNPYLITNEVAIPCSNQVGCLWGASQAGDTSMGGVGWIPDAFPKGYAAFYGMKYKITQGQYADFLNTLTGTQAGYRYPGSSPTNRHAITVSSGVYTSSLPYVACNFLSWADGAAYADWAGLRPMTELEFEKACRGTNAPVANEYAWGTVNITQATNILNAGAANEAPQPALANCVYGSHASVQGPMRVDCMGIGTGSRERTGAGYYGMMELSGNLWERTVTVGNATGRSFTGLHGDGALDATTGNADATGWPAPATASGAGCRGAGWTSASSGARVSDRDIAAIVSADRNTTRGWRGVRLAP